MVKPEPAAAGNSRVGTLLLAGKTQTKNQKKSHFTPATPFTNLTSQLSGLLPTSEEVPGAEHICAMHHAHVAQGNSFFMNWSPNKIFREAIKLKKADSATRQ